MKSITRVTTLSLLISVFTIGCGTDTSSGPEASASPVANQASLRADTVYELLQGHFDSSDQAINDPTYFDISLKMCPVDAPWLGERVLYVEQAVSTRLAEPYRQRLYVIAPLGDDVVSRVFELTAPQAFIGLCDQDQVIGINEGDAAIKSGCEVYLAEQGETYIGGTAGKGCLSSLNGASYAASDVTLTEGQVTSWDRGYDAQDNQVWGATDGPYRFVRLQP